MLDDVTKWSDGYISNQDTDSSQGITYVCVSYNAQTIGLNRIIWFVPSDV